MITSSVAETIDIGRKIGKLLKGGEIFAVTGDLGAGKTHFIKGIASGCCQEAATEKTTSPTFVLVNEYEGRLLIYHIDAYRLESEKEFENLGFDDMISEDSVVLIEWADKVAGCIADTNPIKIDLKHISETKRQLSLSNLPDYISEKLHDIK
ncbi:tRNA (adenosine(37)-N6)-threonylcarbamoyltransferase complex ATPase subunit type 1 TsaE [Sedimentisphaera salicampi]|uniref:tRNA threonylcarbamoyladenosine biosynthesis protein TsaE n=1 Tax=Sedimentisphaera salicampi TaxID=1941349 RepID=A0A1W6LQ13_9BACT|nr:tRNA (adenosine(37)-N6)-threonylcarbamoyltransferase complex ATPase subunit type 1 TsaE [Sedimentisphaera salicampi]ARN57813.1 ADP-binding protein [Sedimentisphaera salicampi]